MITQIKGKTINDVVFQAIKRLLENGVVTDSRNGKIYAEYNAFLELENPRARHLSLEGRKNNIFAMIGETFWVFAGSNKIDPYLSFFLPRAKDFSDDGETWRGGYPERIIDHNQIKDAVQQFKNEGITSRRSVIAIYNPKLDTQEALKEVYGLENTKDRPCNLLLDFFITPDKRLHMNAKSRSGDIIWGLGSINIFEWTFLQEMITQYVAEEVDSEVTLGTYNHFVTNMHLYEFTGKQGIEVLKQAENQQLHLEANDKLIFPKIDDVHNFFRELVWDYYSTKISKGDKKTDLNGIFEKYGVPTENNLLFDYAKLIDVYIDLKLEGYTGKNKSNLTYFIGNFSPELKRAIEYSPFRNFRVLH